MARISLKIRNSNWETVAFLLIFDLIKRTGSKSFVRSDLMKGIDKAVGWLRQLNHKNHPAHPEETLQRTIQNLRDKDYILFHGQGEYELTDPGLSECNRVAKEFITGIDESILKCQEDHLIENVEKLKELTQGMSLEEIQRVFKGNENS